LFLEVQVLKETDGKILEVTVSQGGSWVPVSTCGNQSNSGSDVIPVEGCEVGSKAIDLSDIADEELTGIRQNSNEIQLPERKPDKQTLQAINENRGNPSQESNQVVRQRDTVEQPGIVNVPDVTATAQTSQNFAGPSRAGRNCNDGMALNVNGGVSHTPVPGTARMPVHSQPAPSAQLPPAANHDPQGKNSQSRTGPHVNSPAGPVNGHRTSTQLLQPQTGIPSNIGFITRNESTVSVLLVQASDPSSNSCISIMFLTLRAA
jgi:hypothetical protein